MFRHGGVLYMWSPLDTIVHTGILHPVSQIFYFSLDFSLHLPTVRYVCCHNALRFEMSVEI